VEPLTGIPFDSSASQPVTSMSNVGFYLAAIAVAYSTQLTSRADALGRSERVIAALEKVEKWRGFPRPWILVRSLDPSFGEEFSYDMHMSVLIGGLIVAKNTFPEFRDRIERILLDMQFSDLYDPKNKWLKGGYNVKNQNFAIFQPWGHWYYKYFASSVRLLSFYAIARKAIPDEHWTALSRAVVEREGEQFFATGIEQTAFADQYLAGLFLDERKTEMGESQRSQARYQMKHAEKIGSPVWGWAPAESPQVFLKTYRGMSLFSKKFLSVSIII